MFADHALNTDASKQIKDMVSCPVITVNKINDPEMADTMIKMGKADFIAMGRRSRRINGSQNVSTKRA